MNCRSCEIELDGHADTEGTDASPEEGDLSMCIYCGALGFYTVTGGVLGIREPSAEEHRSLIRDPYVRSILMKRRELMTNWSPAID